MLNTTPFLFQLLPYFCITTHTSPLHSSLLSPTYYTPRAHKLTLLDIFVRMYDESPECYHYYTDNMRFESKLLV